MEKDPTQNPEKGIAADDDDPKTSKRTTKPKRKVVTRKRGEAAKQAAEKGEQSTERPAVFFAKDFKATADEKPETTKQHTAEKPLETKTTTQDSEDEAATRDKIDAITGSKTDDSSSAEAIDAVERTEHKDDYYEQTRGDSEQESAEVFAEDGEKEADLSEAEVHDAVNAIIDGRSEELAEELEQVPEGGPDEAEALADVLFLESLRERADGERDMTPESINDAYEEALSDFSAIPEDVESTDEMDDGEMSEETATIHDLDSNEEGDGTASENSEEGEDNSGSDSPSASTVGTVSSDSSDTGVAPPPLSPPPGGGGAPPSGNVPPAGMPPIGGGGGMAPHNFYPGSATATSGYNNSRPAAATTETVVNRRRRGRDMLVGAVLGYVVGRRGGRKRTEKKLNPKIDKLEKQVGVLHDAITEKEEKIRHLVREKASKSPVVVQQLVTEAIEKRTERTVSKEKKKHKEELNRNPAVESLGSLNLKSLEVFREKRLIDGNENSPKRKAVEVMTVDELLEKIGSVEVDGLPIAEAYKKGQIDAASLREVTKRYLRSGDFASFFRRELKTDPDSIAETRNRLERAHEQQAQVVESSEANLNKESAKTSYKTTAQPQEVFSRQHQSADFQQQNQFNSAADHPRTTELPPKEPRKSSRTPIYVAGITAAVTILLLLLLTYA